MNKLVRITTVPISLEKLLENQLRFMAGHYEVIAVSSDEKSLKNVAETQNARAFPLELTRKITPLKDLIALWQLYRFLKKEKPLIVHSHTPKAGTIGMLAAFLAKVPIRLHTVAGLPLLETSGKKRKLLNAVEKITYACATNVYPNSYGLKDIIIRQKFCHSDKLKVIAKGSSNGIDTDYFSPEKISGVQQSTLKKQLGIENGDFVFIFVGRIVTDKGINELINAFKRMEAKHIKLLLVGPIEKDLDPLEQETEATVASHRNILSVGYQSDVRPYLAISDCLVFPSYREGFPNVVMQAGAMGLPSIVSDINGCNEIIIHGENGLIIPPKSANAIYEAMIAVVNGTLGLKDNAREMIVSRYRQDEVWEAVLNEYKSLERNV